MFCKFFLLMSLDLLESPRSLKLIAFIRVYHVNIFEPTLSQGMNHLSVCQIIENNIICGKSLRLV